MVNITINFHFAKGPVREQDTVFLTDLFKTTILILVLEISIRLDGVFE